jgi:hypothetical protein
MPQSSVRGNGILDLCDDLVDRKSAMIERNPI